MMLLHLEEAMISGGNILTMRDAPMHSSCLFEAELDILELLDYKPIITKGYSCMLHIHTFSDEVTIKDIVWAYEKDNHTQELVKKEKPKFAKSFTKILCRIQSNKPIPLEKSEVMPALGRFTMRDEGKTIACGKVMKYKPYKEVPVTTSDVVSKMEGLLNNQNPASTAGDLVFNLDTEEAEKPKPALDGIAEGNDDEGDE